MFKITSIFRLLFESIAYIVLLLLTAVIIIYSVKLLVRNGTMIQAPSYCENNIGQPMKIKKIISINNSIAELQMDDDSIKNYIIKQYSRDYKGRSSVRHIGINVNDIVCIKN